MACDHIDFKCRPIIIHGIHIMACDHIHIEIYTVIQVTHNHDNSIVF